MRAYDSPTAAALAASAVVARHLVWIVGRDRFTGAAAPLGLSNLDDAQSVSIGGQARLYHGAGALMGLEPIRAGVGLDVRILRLTFSPLAPEVVTALRSYEPRLGAVEIHRALFDPDTLSLVAAPHRVWRGWVNELRVVTGEAATAELDVASAARGLTRPLTLRRSDAAMRRRSAADAFRRWTDISGEIGVWWGERRHDPKPATTEGGAASDEVQWWQGAEGG